MRDQGQSIFNREMLRSPIEFAPGTDAEHVQSIKAVHLNNQFRNDKTATLALCHDTDAPAVRSAFAGENPKRADSEAPYSHSHIGQKLHDKIVNRQYLNPEVHHQPIDYKHTKTH